jgi:hypothetical protein
MPDPAASHLNLWTKLLGHVPEAVWEQIDLEILSLFGTIDFDPNYDYKAERRKRR